MVEVLTAVVGAVVAAPVDVAVAVVPLLEVELEDVGEGDAVVDVEVVEVALLLDEVELDVGLDALVPDVVA